MPLDRRSLVAFLNIARFGSLGLAANAMSVTQPALSRTLRKLEEELKVDLFVRHSTGMELTTFGRALLPHAHALEMGLGRAMEEIELLRGSSKGIARFGLLPSLAPHYLPNIVKNLGDKLPGIQLHVIEAPSHQLFRALMRGAIDFSIAAISPEITEQDIHITPLVNDELCVVARTKHPIMENQAPTPADLRLYDWALQEKGGEIWRQFQMMFASAHLDLPPVILTSNSTETLKKVISCNDIITILPRITIKAEEAKNIIRPVPGSSASWQRQLAILRNSRTPVLPAVNLVMGEVRKILVQSLS